MAETTAFEYDGGRVEPGERSDFRFTVSETYLGDPIRIPVSIINGPRPGPTVFLSAAVHGDELNGIEAVRETAMMVDPADVSGTLVCLPVVNVPAFLTQQRYFPIYDRDLNRAFPGERDSTSTKRMAERIFTNFVEPCDIGLDFHTSTRGRTNVFHVRGDIDDDEIARLAHTYGSNVIVSSSGPSGGLRREASERGVPTITIEMGEAHRFQREFIEQAKDGIGNVCTEYGVREADDVEPPDWRTIVDSPDEKTWLRANKGGMVEMQYDRGSLVREGEPICTIQNPFGHDKTTVDAPFTGLILGIIRNPLVYPGNPVAHFVEVDDETRRTLESE